MKGFYGYRQLKPESQEEKKLSETTNGKRALLERFARNDALTCQVFRMAQYDGLSGEDKYVELAYHALLRAELFESRLLNSLNLQACPPFVVTDLALGITAEGLERLRREHAAMKEELERLRPVDAAARAYVKTAGKPGVYAWTTYTALYEALSPA